MEVCCPYSIIFINFYKYILGDKKLRSVLTDGTKSSTTLKKAMVAPKRFVRRRKQSPDRRDRSRSPAAKRPDRSSSGAGSSGSGAKKASYSDNKRKYCVDDGAGSSKDSSNRWTRSKKAKAKKKGTLPLSISAKSNVLDFLSVEAQDMVKAVGLDLDRLSIVDNLPVGGRIQKFFSNWLKINCSDWVLTVVRDGYKIPLLSVPHQQKVPTNPKAKGEAFNVLVKEAEDLLLKEAVRVVEPCEGQYISSYFAVRKPRKVDQFRPILNLKYFNNNVRKYHFSMETLAAVRDWIKPGYFCISLDIKVLILNYYLL